MRAQFEKTKDGPDGWKARGDAIHKVFANHLAQGEGSIHDDKWTPWIDTLLAEPLLQDITPLAVEQPLLNTIKRVGGTPDAIFVKGDDIYIADLKTVSKKKVYLVAKRPCRSWVLILNLPQAAIPACTSPSW